MLYFLLILFYIYLLAQVMENESCTHLKFETLVTDVFVAANLFDVNQFAMQIAAMHNTWLESKVTTPYLFAGLPCYFALLNKSRMLRTPCQQTPKTHTDKRLHKIDLLSVWKRGIYISKLYTALLLCMTICIYKTPHNTCMYSS